MKILCFGDSNTFGYISGGLGRFASDVRYTGVMKELLAPDYTVYEDGLNGRTTIFQDPVPGRRGIDAISGSVSSYNPEILFLMLGTNDCKADFANEASDITKGVVEIARAAQVVEPDLKVILCAPTKIIPDALYQVNYYNPHSLEVNAALSESYKKAAADNGYYFMDASEFAEPDPADGEHMNAENHRKLGEAVAAKIREWFD